MRDTVEVGAGRLVIADKLAVDDKRDGCGRSELAGDRPFVSHVDDDVAAFFTAP